MNKPKFKDEIANMHFRTVNKFDEDCSGGGRMIYVVIYETYSRGDYDYGYEIEKIYKNRDDAVRYIEANTVGINDRYLIESYEVE